LAFAPRGGALLEEIVVESEAYRRAARWLDDGRRVNERTVLRLQRGFAVAMSAVTVDVILWLLDFVTR
jgi:hypothetical protein